MPDSLPALCVGAVLIAIGIGMAWFQCRYRQPNERDDELSRRHASRQLRRRLQVSALMILAGILIPVGDLVPVFRNRPIAFALFWAAILLLTFWIMLLALADLLSARSYHRLANLHLRQERRAIEREIDRYRSAGNGHASSRED